MLKRFTAFFIGLICCLILLELSLAIIGLVSRTRKTLANSHAGPRTSGTITIACMGESITHCGYPDFLKEALERQLPEQNFKVLDKSMVASDSNYIPAALPKVLAEDNPDIVIVMTGINDNKDPVLFEKAIRPFSFKHSRVYRLLRFLAPLVFDDTQKLGFWRQRLEPDVWKRKKINIKKLKQRFKEKTITEYELSKLWDFYLNNNDGDNAQKIWDIIEQRYGRENYILAYIVRMLIPQKKYTQSKYMLQEFSKTNPDNISALLINDIIDELNSVQPQALLGAYPDIINAPEFLDKLKAPEKWIQERYFYHTLISYLEINQHWKQAKELAIQSRNAFPRSPLLTHALIRLYKQTNDFENLEQILNEQETLEIFGKDWVRASLITCLQAQGKTKQTQALSKQTDTNTIFPLTVQNYKIIIKQILAAGKIPVLMSYPTQSSSSIQTQLSGFNKAVYFINNGPLFRDAVLNQGYNTVFKDMYAGSFGHLTEFGNKLLANHIASNIIRQKIIREK